MDLTKNMVKKREMNENNKSEISRGPISTRKKKSPAVNSNMIKKKMKKRRKMLVS